MLDIKLVGFDLRIKKIFFIFGFSLISNLNAQYIRDDIKEIVKDTDTGLIWQDNSSTQDAIKTWEGAIFYCKLLSLGGYDDWILPNFNELYGLADRSKYDPALDDVFKYFNSSYYWSATTYVYSTDGAWYVNFDEGNVYISYKTGSHYFRCVRLGGIKNLKPTADNIEIDIDNLKPTVIEFTGDDKDGDSLTYEIVSKSTGTLSDVVGSQIIYNPTGFNDSFTYKSYDGKDYSDVATVNINYKLLDTSKIVCTSDKILIDNSCETKTCENGGLTGDDCKTQIVKDECDFPNNSLNIHPKGECEFKDTYDLGSKIEFELTSIDKYGFKSQLSVATKCKVNENNDVTSYVKSQSTIFIENDGLSTITCADGNFKTTEIIKTTNFDGGTLDAVIIIGKDQDDDPLKNTFSKSGEKIYRLLYSQGYRDENIHYFNSVDNEQKLVDIDGDGIEDNVIDYHSYTSEDIESKGLDKIGDSKNPLLFYIVDHGSDKGSILLNGETSVYLSLYNLKNMLNNFYKRTGREQIVVIDSCYSGIFVDGLKDDHRVVYSSASATQTIPMNINNGINFTQYFIQRLAKKYTLNESFEYATEKYKNSVQNYFPEPQSSGSDLSIANSSLGYIFTSSVDPISDFYGKDSKDIKKSTKTLYLTSGNILSETTSRVYAYITPPQIIDIQKSDNVISVLSEEIELKYNASKERFETNYNFDKDGIYQINYELIDGASDTFDEEVNIQVGSSTQGVKFIDNNTTLLNKITLNSGWNLTTLPTTDIDNHKLIWGYSNHKWEVKSNNNAIQNVINKTSIDKLAFIDKNKGYWIFNDNSINLDFGTQTTTSLQTRINNLEKGWNILSSYNDLNIDTLSGYNTIWSYKNNKWSAYSLDNKTLEKIDNNSNINILSNISKFSGVWVSK